MSKSNLYFLSDNPLPYLMTLTSEHREVWTGQIEIAKINDCSNPSAGLRLVVNNKHGYVAKSGLFGTLVRTLKSPNSTNLLCFQVANLA